MEIILLENIRKLGQVGSVVKVKDGYGRNFLIPRKKAIRASKENLAYFQAKKDVIEQQNEANKQAASQLASRLTNMTINIVRQSAEDGRLFGSVNARDIANLINSKDIKIDKSNIVLNDSIKYTGTYQLDIALHSEVIVKIGLNVARSEAEAEAFNQKAKVSEKIEDKVNSVTL